MQSPSSDSTHSSPSSTQTQKDKDPFFKGFLKSLNLMRQTQQFIDVIITAQNEIFAAHKLILSIHSSYFCQLFQENSGLTNISFKVPSYGVRILLDYFYTGQINITQGNFIAVQKAAELFKVERVLNLCHEFESSSLTTIKSESMEIIQDNEPTTSMAIDDENISGHDDDDDDTSSISSGIYKANHSVYQGSTLRKRYFSLSSSTTKSKLLKGEFNSSSNCKNSQGEYQNLIEHSSSEPNLDQNNYSSENKSCFVVPHVQAVSYASSTEANNSNLFQSPKNDTSIESPLPTVSNSSLSSVMKVISEGSEAINNVLECKLAKSEFVSSSKVKSQVEHDRNIEIKSEADSPEAETAFKNADFENDLLPNYAKSERSSSVTSQGSQNQSVLSPEDCGSSKNNDISSQSFVPVDVEIREDQSNSTGCFDYFPLNSLENLVTDDYFKFNINTNFSSGKGLNLIINNIPVSVVLSSKPKAYVCGRCGESIIGLHTMTSHIQTVHKSVNQNDAQSISENEHITSKIKIDVTDILVNSRPQAQNQPPESVPSGASIACETCGLVFDYLWDLFKHQDQVHKVKSVLSCDACPYIGNNERNLHFHRYSVHGVSLPIEWEKKAQRCPYCPHIARAPSMLKSHISRKHLDEQNAGSEFFCGFCSARFSYSASLTKHLKKHTEDVTSD